MKNPAPGNTGPVTGVQEQERKSQAVLLASAYGGMSNMQWTRSALLDRLRLLVMSSRSGHNPANRNNRVITARMTFDADAFQEQQEGVNVEEES
jgi:hypothetical protein